MPFPAPEKVIYAVWGGRLADLKKVLEVFVHPPYTFFSPQAFLFTSAVVKIVVAMRSDTDIDFVA